MIALNEALSRDALNFNESRKFLIYSSKPFIRNYFASSLPTKKSSLTIACFSYFILRCISRTLLDAAVKYHRTLSQFPFSCGSKRTEAKKFASRTNSKWLKVTVTRQRFWEVEAASLIELEFNFRHRKTQSRCDASKRRHSKAEITQSLLVIYTNFKQLVWSILD